MARDKHGCLILEYYRFLGKKWGYPIFYHMKGHKDYPFEDFIFITNRKISRSVLHDLLKNAMSLSIISRSKKGYRLTKLGVVLKQNLQGTRSVLQNHNPKACVDCNSRCLINKQRA